MLQVISSNAHSFSLIEFGLKNNVNLDLEQSELNEVASCLYPSLSLINHSCNPNVFNVGTSKAHTNVYAIRPIQAGEMICGNYGLIYAKHSLKKRRKDLQDQYYFICKCVACYEDWPNVLELAQSLKIYLKCLKCKGVFEPTKLSCLKLQNPCRCSGSIQQKSLLIYKNKVHTKMKLKTSVIQEYNLKSLSKKVIKHSTKKTLNEIVQAFNDLSNIVSKPSVLLDWWEQYLVTLIDLRDGFWFVRC